MAMWAPVRVFAHRPTATRGTLLKLHGSDPHGLPSRRQNVGALFTRRMIYVAKFRACMLSTL